MTESGRSDKKGMSNVKLSSGHYLYYINQDAVLKNVEERGYREDPSLKQISHSDLTTGIYEGGFKVWECSIDLCEYIDSVLEPQVLSGKRILELGCGAGLPSILALQKGAKEVTLQDYNGAVIDCFTKDNFAVNDVEVGNCRFYACDWATLQQKLDGHKFDVILTAETIYNEDYYGSLHDLFDSLLLPSGLVLLAAKVYYFGVGGNIPTFMEYVKTRCLFDSHICWSSKSDVPRKIVQLTQRSCP